MILRFILATLSFCLVGILVFFIFYTFPQKGLIEEHNSYLRVVSLAPSFSETVEKLGQSYRLVGITTNCNIKESEKIAKIGSFAQINLEAILSLKPDLVLAVPHVLAQPILKKIAEHNIEIFAHQPDSIKDIEEIISVLGTKFNVKKTSEILIEKIRGSIQEARNTLANNIDFEQKNKFILAISSTPFVVASSASFPSEILEQIGFANLVKTKIPVWPIWPIENIITMPPDLIIFSEGEDSLIRYQNLINQLSKTSHNIKLITPKNNIFSSPSPKIIKDIKHFVELIKQENNHAI